jgi:small-conductance mechanosensitive channel
MPLVQKVAALVMGLLVVTAIAKHFGRDISTLVAALGVGSVAIGLAAQHTLGNMIAGFVLLVDRPFRPGDRIKLASGESGEVLEVGVRSTRILMPDRNLLIVPNAELVNARVVNFTYPSKAGKGEVKVTLPADGDVDRASALLVEAALADKRVLAEPAPVVRLSALLPTGIELVLGFDVAEQADAVAVEDLVRRQCLRRFAGAKITLAGTAGVTTVRVLRD